MEQLNFDAAGFIEFDLNAGLIRSTGKEELALVPLDVLAALEPREGLKDAAHKWGLLHGKRLAERLAFKGKSVGIEILANHIGGTAATLGMGRLSMEIRGDALIFRTRMESNIAASTGFVALLAGFIAGYLSAFVPQAFEVLSLGETEGDQLFWSGSPDAVQQVLSWIDEGMEPLAAVRRLAEGK